jgi:CDGSH-type Zn-finger protein
MSTIDLNDGLESEVFEIKMSKSVIAQKLPLLEELDAGKSYFWCACGRSQSQPFCEGSHKDTEFLPVKYKSANSEKVFFCCCKRTSNPPFCNGMHNSI